MPQYVAFLRGINVGGHRVKMDRLKELFEELSFTNVSTFIVSGNVIFSGSQIFWRVQGKISESPLFGKELERALRGIPSTARNMNTLRRISGKVSRQDEGS